MKVILQLGGSVKRSITAAQLATAMPDAKIVVSTELGNYRSYYEAAGIDLSRIVYDGAAWDTVTNFTHTYKLLKHLHCSHLYVVTDHFHIYRSRLIATACWLGRAKITMVKHGSTERPSDRDYAPFDLVRVLLWRLLGIELFDKEVRQQRVPGYQLSNEHGIEIGL